MRLLHTRQIGVNLFGINGVRFEIKLLPHTVGTVVPVLYTHAAECNYESNVRAQTENKL